MKLIIFDLDGTILDTVAGLGAAINMALADQGFAPITVEQCASFVGNGYMKLTERALSQDQARFSQIKEEEKEGFIYQVSQAFMSHYADIYLGYGTAFEGIVPLLEDLMKKGVRLAVNSNKKHPLVKPMLDKFLPTIHFDSAWGELEDAPRKPDPQGVFRILNEIKANLGVEDFEEVLYVGDSEVDLKTAQNAGIKAIHVQWGTRTYEQIKELPHLLSTNDAGKLYDFIFHKYWQL